MLIKNKKEKNEEVIGKKGEAIKKILQEKQRVF